MVAKKVYLKDSEIIDKIRLRVSWQPAVMPAEGKLIRAIFGNTGIELDEIYAVAYLLSHEPIALANDYDPDIYAEKAASWVREHLAAESERMKKARPIIDELFNTLEPREARVLTLRFGFDNHPPRTLEEVGHEFSVGRERIRQIEAKALRKLRHPSRSRRLRQWIVSADVILDRHVDRRMLWGLAWWVDRWAERRERNIGTETAELKRTVREKDKEIDYLKLELTRCQTVAGELKAKLLAKMPLSVPLKEMSLEQLGLPRWVEMPLKRADVHTVEDVLLLLDDQAKHIRGIGAKSLALLRARILELQQREKREILDG